MGASAAETHHEAHDEASPPNDYGGRVPAQKELPYPVDTRGRIAYFQRHKRRRASPWSRVECDVAIAILSCTSDETGRCDASTMGLLARAHCSRSHFFEVLARLEGLAVMELRQRIDPHFKDCRHTIGGKWKSLHACKRLRRAALAEGRPFTCIAHHGRTVIRWSARTDADLEEAVMDRAPAPVRAKRYRTPTPPAYRTETDNPYRTPTPGTRLLKSDTEPSTTLRDKRPARARASCARRDDSPAARRAFGAGSSLPGEATPTAAAAARTRPPEPPRGAAGPSAPPAPARMVPAFRELGTETESKEGTGSVGGVPLAELAAGVERVLREHRAAEGSTLARRPATVDERRGVAALLASGMPPGELVEAVRGRPLLPRQHGASLALLLSSAPLRMAAVEAWRKHVTLLERAAAARLEREARAAAATLPPSARDAPVCEVPVFDVAALLAKLDRERGS